MSGALVCAADDDDDETSRSICTMAHGAHSRDVAAETQHGSLR